jgi:hypothetical protein
VNTGYNITWIGCWGLPSVRRAVGFAATIPHLQQHHQHQGIHQSQKDCLNILAGLSEWFFNSTKSQTILKLPSRQIGSTLEYHWIGLEKDINATGFWFFYFTLEYLKILQSSGPLHAKINPTSCLFGSWFAQNPVFLLAGALLFDEKICQSAALFWFGLRDAEILYSQG